MLTGSVKSGSCFDRQAGAAGAAIVPSTAIIGPGQWSTIPNWLQIAFPTPGAIPAACVAPSSDLSCARRAAMVNECTAAGCSARDATRCIPTFEENLTGEPGPSATGVFQTPVAHVPGSPVGVISLLRRQRLVLLERRPGRVEQGGGCR